MASGALEETGSLYHRKDLKRLLLNRAGFSKDGRREAIPGATHWQNANDNLSKRRMYSAVNRPRVSKESGTKRSSGNT